VERTTPFARIFVFSVASAMRLPITPWTDASSGRSLPANCDWLKVSPSYLRPGHRQSSPSEHAWSYLDPQRPIEGSPTEWLQNAEVTHNQPNPVSSEEEKSYELSNMLL